MNNWIFIRSCCFGLEGRDFLFVLAGTTEKQLAGQDHLGLEDLKRKVD